MVSLDIDMMTESLLPTQYEVDDLFMDMAESSIDWSDVLVYFRQTSVKTYSEDFVDDNMERGYLQVLYRSHVSLTNEDDDDDDDDDEYDELAKLEIAELLIRESISKVGGKKMATELSAQDSSGNCALHFLFGNVPYDHTGISPAHIRLVMDLCHEINPHIYWIELCSIQNCHGMTPLHFLAEQYASEATKQIIPTIIIRIDEAMLFATRTTADGNKKDSCRHPLMITDGDGDSALNIVCMPEDCTCIEIDPELVGAFLGFLDEESSYKESYELVFHENLDGRTPVTNLISTFLATYHDALNNCYACNNFITEEEDEVMAFHSFLGSTNIDVSDIKMLIERHLWPQIRILLEAAIKRNTHHDDKRFRDEVSVPDLPTHLAACVENMPCLVLHIACSIDPFSSNHLDEFGNTPLHWALCHSGVKGLKDHDKINETVLMWRSRGKERSIVEYLLCREPSCVSTRDKYERLPLHCAISNGCDFQHYIKPLLQLCPKHVWESDPKTNLKPFMFAALHGKGDVCFNLLIIDPSVCTSCVFPCS